MIVDSSALIAVLFKRTGLAAASPENQRVAIDRHSAANYFEAAIVFDRRTDREEIDRLGRFISTADVSIVPSQSPRPA